MIDGVIDPADAATGPLVAAIPSAEWDVAMALHVCRQLADVVRDLRRRTRSRRLFGIAAYGRLFLSTRLRGSAG